MLLRWMLRRAAYCVPLGSVVIRSTRGGAPYPHTTAGVDARLEPGVGGAGGGRGSRTSGWCLFVGALAAYTLVRQGILRLRAEPRKTRLGGLVTTALAALVLIAAVVFLAR